MAARIRSIEKSSDLIGTEASDLLARSVVPQRAALTHAPCGMHCIVWCCLHSEKPGHGIVELSADKAGQDVTPLNLEFGEGDKQQHKAGGGALSSIAGELCTAVRSRDSDTRKAVVLHLTFHMCRLCGIRSSVGAQLQFHVLCPFLYCVDHICYQDTCKMLTDAVDLVILPIQTQIYLTVKRQSVACYLCSVFGQECGVGKLHMAQLLFLTVEPVACGMYHLCYKWRGNHNVLRMILFLEVIRKCLYVWNVKM
jgi:hypothetical protein